ncbi:serine hydrolase domain-containing protein [Streptomyces thermolineatus]|uniref:serine hydrolase domain-containing protein n=1 Tax=Streptomyces thermolineatus TaxID=44033 RepID=UPI00384C6F6E
MPRPECGGTTITTTTGPDPGRAPGPRRPVLRRGSAEEAGLDPGGLAALVDGLAAHLVPGPGRPRPWCAGAVVLAGRGGTVVLEEALGHAFRYTAYDEATDTGVEAPPEEWVPATVGTVFDIASLTKPFTALVAVRHALLGDLGLDDPVARHLPSFSRAREAGITVRHLLTHTSGLRPELPLYEAGTAAERLRMLRDEAPLHAPGTAVVYSDLNMVLLQLLLEEVTGRGLDALVAEEVTGPLGMRSTRFVPPASWRARTAATEDQRRPWARADRGMLRGEVHDENAHALGGVAGHAGLFSTARDLALLCRGLLDGGPAADLVLGEGLGLELDRPWYMGELSGPRTAGHTGFTGTSLILDPVRDVFLVLLANSVHPVRSWRSGSVPRATAATHLARACLP